VSRRIFVVVGAKGGVGASMIAIKLIDLLQAPAERVIVDADLSGKRCLAVWYDASIDLDLGRVIGSPAVAKSKAGPFVMELARTYEDGFILTDESVADSIERLPQNALVVVDAPQPFASTVRAFVSRAAKIVVVTEPNLMGIGAARSMLSAMDRFGLPLERIAFVLNDVRGSGDLRRADIERALRVTVSAELPEITDRRFNKTFAGFVELLAASPIQEPLENLRQSTEKPLGDRREPRDVPESSASGRARNDDAVQATGPSAAIDDLKTELHALILTRIDFFTAGRADTDAKKHAELRDQIDKIATEFLASRADVKSAEVAARIRREVIEEALGLGPLESLLHEEDITEIMVNGHDNVFVERHGRVERTTKKFVDDRQVRLVIERIIAPLGRRLDESSPMVDARLPDGSRVNAVIEPLSIDGPTLTIRRFGTQRMHVADLITVGALTLPIINFLRAAVEARQNILVSGGTGSGKTTLLNALSSFIPHAERIITIEDVAELKLEQPHVVRLEARPPNLEGTGGVSIRDLVRNSLRMRPDRIVVGECRGGEALDMLQAMNTGHDGSLTTIHANSARDALSRVETMVLMSGYELPLRAIRQQTASAIDLVIQVARLRDGARRVTGISEVTGIEGDMITMQELIKYQQHGISAQGKVIGEFESTGVQPDCLKRFEELGVDFNPAIFSTVPAVEPEVTWAR
jgi:Flp pilus assembly CpaF family ATPase/MinD-like ATPase involved in chromosome partitioning or flagellar assembly